MLAASNQDGCQPTHEDTTRARSVQVLKGELPPPLDDPSNSPRKSRPPALARRSQSPRQEHLYRHLKRYRDGRQFDPRYFAFVSDPLAVQELNKEGYVKDRSCTSIMESSREQPKTEGSSTILETSSIHSSRKTWPSRILRESSSKHVSERSKHSSSTYPEISQEGRARSDEIRSKSGTSIASKSSASRKSKGKLTPKLLISSSRGTLESYGIEELQIHRHLGSQIPQYKAADDRTSNKSVNSRHLSRASQQSEILQDTYSKKSMNVPDSTSLHSERSVGRQSNKSVKAHSKISRHSVISEGRRSKKSMKSHSRISQQSEGGKLSRKASKSTSMASKASLEKQGQERIMSRDDTKSNSIRITESVRSISRQDVKSSKSSTKGLSTVSSHTSFAKLSSKKSSKQESDSTEIKTPASPLASQTVKSTVPPASGSSLTAQKSASSIKIATPQMKTTPGPSQQPLGKSVVGNIQRPAQITPPLQFLHKSVLPPANEPTERRKGFYQPSSQRREMADQQQSQQRSNLLNLKLQNISRGQNIMNSKSTGNQKGKLPSIPKPPIKSETSQSDKQASTLPHVSSTSSAAKPTVKPSGTSHKPGTRQMQSHSGPVGSLQGNASRRPILKTPQQVQQVGNSTNNDEQRGTEEEDSKSLLDSQRAESRVGNARRSVMGVSGEKCTLSCEIMYLKEYPSLLNRDFPYLFYFAKQIKIRRA